MRDVGNGFAAPADGELAAELKAAGFVGAEEIGRGGSGVVYRCAEPALDRVVAVKVLTVDLDDHRPRFEREQHAMGRLTGHPNIVAVLQGGETESGHPYLVMPYLQRGSLEDRIRRFGLLPVDEVLLVGVKVAGALESAHRLGIVHRDVKPANIMLTDYGEPALTDFGIAHIPDGFKTAAGVFTGTPAFIAPEVLGGSLPSPASDTYGLGATLFCALTGHAAFERHSGEEVMAQFVRIATRPVPDLRERGIPDDVTAIVEQAMCREPGDRISLLALGDALAQLQAERGLAVDEMALPGGDRADRLSARPPHQGGAPRRGGRRLPARVASFVGRVDEAAELRLLLSTARLVTLTGVGGVGKTTLAMHVARELSERFGDDSWFVELADLREGSLLTEVVAAAVGLRNQSAGPLVDVLVEFIRPREALLVLDNCEHLIDATADLIQTLLRECPHLSILATSREVLGVDGESVVPLVPLPCPRGDGDPTVTELAGYDAVALFIERARAAVPSFALTDHNAGAVARICARLDGLPLALELAAGRLRAMSLRQVADGLSDRYALLNQGRRGAPSRQQTLAWCVKWSYELCTPAEQRLWSRLSVFAGGFDLPAAKHVCGENVRDDDFLEQLSALVDKSILIRTEHDDAVRFRLLETLREYGAMNLADSEDQLLLCARHADWYRQLTEHAEAEWFGPRQIEWIQRITREMPNIRKAADFTLTTAPDTALQMLGAMRQIWFTGAMLTEAHRWLDVALAATTPRASPHRIQGLCAAAVVAGMQLDPGQASIRLAELHEHLQVVTDPVIHAWVSSVESMIAWFSGDFQHAYDCVQQGLSMSDAPEVQLSSMFYAGAALCAMGEIDQSAEAFEEALEISESLGERVWRSRFSSSLGLVYWLSEDRERAERMLGSGLEGALLIDDPYTGAHCLEILAWIAGANNDMRRAATLLAAASAVARAIGTPHLGAEWLQNFHDACDRQARDGLGEAAFDAVWSTASSLTFRQAVDVALTQVRDNSDTLVERVESSECDHPG